MPGTTVQAFTDIDRYQELIRGARNIDLLVTGSGEFQAELTKIDLHHLWTQRGQASVSKIMHTTLTSNALADIFSNPPGTSAHNPQRR